MHCYDILVRGASPGGSNHLYFAVVDLCGFWSRHLHILRSSLLTGLYVHNHHVIEFNQLFVLIFCKYAWSIDMYVWDSGCYVCYLGVHKQRQLFLDLLELQPWATHLCNLSQSEWLQDCLLWKVPEQVWWPQGAPRMGQLARTCQKLKILQLHSEYTFWG